MNIAERLYLDLLQLGVEVVLDDRTERIGYKLNDADLIGFPYELIVGNRSLAGTVELKNRKTGEVIDLKIASAANSISKVVHDRLKEVNASA